MKKHYYFLLLCFFLYVFSLGAFASEIDFLDDPESDVVSETISDDEIPDDEETEPGIYYVSVLSESNDYTEILEEIYHSTVSSNDMLASISSDLMQDDDFKDFTEYENLDDFLSSDMYVNRYEYEVYKLLTYMVILQTLSCGLILVSIFIRRSKKHGNS